jgi:hypothetical protein
VSADPFEVDPGPAPRIADPDTDAPPAADGPAVLPAPGLALDPGPDISRIEDGVRGFYRAAFQALHVTIGRGGPADAFQPTDAELEQMVRPAAQVVARSPRATAVAERGDLIGAVGTPAAYMLAEIERVNTYKRRLAEQPEAEYLPDADVADISTAPTGAAGGRRPRAWRPRTDFSDAG